jgi:acetyltransferase-like isoleucine patch superfamily enzyme
MKLKQLLKCFLSMNRKNRRRSSWKERYEVGRGTYGEPTIRHWGEPTTLKVGCFCSIADGVTIFLGGNHRTDWITTYPFSVFWESAKHIEGHPASRGDVIIGHDVWIGAGAVVLSGIHIGNGAVIGAAAVVTHDVPPYSIVAGNPAKVIKVRFSEEEICILQSLEWWSWDDVKLNAAMPLLLNGDVSALYEFSMKYELTSEQGAAPDGNSAALHSRR